MLRTLQEVLPILVPTTLALYGSSYSSLEMTPSVAFEYWLSRFLPETLHGGYVAAEHLWWVVVFPLHDFCSRIRDGTGRDFHDPTRPVACLFDRRSTDEI